VPIVICLNVNSFVKFVISVFFCRLAHNNLPNSNVYGKKYYISKVEESQGLYSLKLKRKRLKRFLKIAKSG